MKGHAELIQHAHEVRHEVAEGHRESIPGRDELLGIEHARFGTGASEQVSQKAAQSQRPRTYIAS